MGPHPPLQGGIDQQREAHQGRPRAGQGPRQLRGRQAQAVLQTGRGSLISHHQMCACRGLAGEMQLRPAVHIVFRLMLMNGEVELENMLMLALAAGEGGTGAPLHEGLPGRQR